MRRKGLTDKQVEAIKRKAKRYIMADPEQRGLYLRFHLKARSRSPPWRAIRSASRYGRRSARPQTWCSATPGGARVRLFGGSRTEQAAIKTPKAKPDSVAVVAENWLRRHVEKNGHRSAGDVRRQIERYVLPYWRDRTFTEIKRADIATLLDRIEDASGAQTADHVLATLRSIASWVQKRDDSYTPPFVRGMKRVPAKVHNRSRTLTDDELRRVWDAASGQFGSLVKLLLLTAQRLDKVMSLRWDDIDAKGIWTIRTEAREKGNPGKLQLPKAALDIIQAQPRFVGNPYVFAGNDGHAFRRNGRSKTALDAASGVADWRLHDLRRTARSLMSRAGVIREHAERVLGHGSAVSKVSTTGIRTTPRRLMPCASSPRWSTASSIHRPITLWLALVARLTWERTPLTTQ